MIDDFRKREHHQSCIKSSCCSHLSKLPSPEVFPLNSFSPFDANISKKTRCSINKTRSLTLVFSSYGWSAFEIARAETLKGFQQRSPWKAPLRYFTSFMCCRHPPDSSRGRNARHSLNTFYTSRHQFAFVARLLHVFYLPWKRSSRLYHCVNDGGKEATWLLPLWFALGWQASSDS